MAIKSKLILPILTALIVSCAQGPQNSVTITGKVANLADTTFFLLSHPGVGTDTIKPDAKGSFSIHLDSVTEPATLYFGTPGDRMATIHVVPGMRIELAFDLADLINSFKFSGKGSDINNYLFEKSKLSLKDPYAWFKLDAPDFRVKQDSMLAVYQGLLNEAKKDDPADPFWATEEGEVLFTWANNLERFQPYHSYFSGKQDYVVPEGFEDYRKDLDINNSRYVKSRSFQSYITDLVSSEVSLKVKSIRDMDSTAEVNQSRLKRETAVELFTSPDVLNVYLLNDVKDAMQWTSLEECQDAIAFFREKCKDEALLKVFETEYDGWKKLDKGQPAPEIIGKNMQGETVKLSDFRGKYLYLDLWATWCGPCNYEIPFLDSLETDYHGRNIVFMSYSIDDDHDAWMKFVPEKQLKGVQIIGDKGWGSQICKDFKILGVPTFMFFDPEGKIISVKMTRPSDKQTRETFNSYPNL